MDETAKAIAEKYGVTDKLNELESRILENRYATSVEFDISGFTDKIYQVIMVIGYDIPASLDNYFEERKRFIGDALAAANESGLKRTEDNIEDHGAHFYIVTDFIKGREWIKKKPVHERSR